MAYASKAGRASTNPASPRAQGVCDRCGIWYQRDQLINQYEWRGTTLLPLYLYVCRSCLDVPQEQLRAIVLSADPVPIVQPRTEPFLADETSYASLGNYTIDPTTGLRVYSTTTLVTAANANVTTQPIGQPVGLEQDAVMPLGLTNGVVTHYGVPLHVLSVISNGSDQITVNCSQAHGLATLDQISVEALSNVNACGFYSVVVTTATQFTYQTGNISIPAGSLLTGSTRMITAQVGLPLGYDTIPQA